MAVDVLVMYGALVVWAVLAVIGVRRRQAAPALIWGLLLTVALNVRYFIEGPPDAIAFFVGIYDVFDNLGLRSDEGAAALARCADNACTVWGDRFAYHPAWGVAFYDRFVDAPQFRTNLLYAHIGANTIAFLLMHLQLARPGSRSGGDRHRVIGRVWFGTLLVGTGGAVWLASQHSAVDEYGAIWAELGFYSMSAFVLATAVIGVRAARSGDMAAHRIWMFRHAGSMWGSFWLFRVMLVVTGPALRGVETASILWSVWASAPLGILVAEIVRRRLDARAITGDHEEQRSMPTADAAPAAGG